jgi:D-alanyl-D-alanine carboxypeptidase/D-alanyl-D-alanine-endopeptidase (penicillin-binding protein 4)
MRIETFDIQRLLGRIVPILLVTSGVLLFGATGHGFGAVGSEAVTSLIGANDSILVMDPQGGIIVAKNETQKLIPASILKIFTSLVALHYLGPDHQYKTEFFFDNNANLKIKGYGDPRLTSEYIVKIARLLAILIGTPTTINDLIVDDSYFSQPLTIPGINSSSQPYDAPNGALCVNFNTVFFEKTPSGYVSAEPQTPLLPYAQQKIIQRKEESGRIVLSHVNHENTIYAGKLFEYFLKQESVQLDGQVKPGRVNHSHDKLIFRYVSPLTLAEIISGLLEHSNNFTTNQLLISAGIKAYGPPGNLDKGVEAALAYASKELAIEDLEIEEGSGIYRKNRVSARQMMRVLEAFEPNYVLLRQQGRDFYKTGTLYGINTRAGYIASANGGRYRYVVMVNTPGKSTLSVMRRLRKILP